MITDIIIIPGLKALVSEIAGKYAGEVAGSCMSETADLMLHEMFGQKNPNTPNGQFLMLIDESYCEFCEFLNDTDTPFEYDSEAYTRIRVITLKCSSYKKLLNDILVELIGEESYNLLGRQDIEKWNYIVDYKLAGDKYQVLYRYILNHSEKKEKLDTESVLKIVKALNTIRSEETIEDVLCAWFSEQCSKGYDYINRDILEVGYILTDYLEKRKKYGKSVEIANQLLNIYKNDKCGIAYDKEYIRKIIGCAYSLAIAYVKPEDKKMRLLRDSEFFFNEAYSLCKNYENEINQYEDICFLWGLYYSDYGAMLVNMGKYYEKKEMANAVDYYKRAEISHKLSLDNRLHLKEALQDSNLYDEDEIDNMIARTISNLGGVYFYLEQYNDSITEQKKALKIFEKQGDRIREYRTKELIVGSYISLWKKNINLMKQSDFDLCMKYLESARFYYEITNNKSMNGILEKIRELSNLSML